MERNLFDHPNKVFKNKILLVSRFENARQGTIKIARFGKLTLGRKIEDCIPLAAEVVTKIAGAQEPVDMVGRMVEPYARQGLMYLPYVFRQMESIPVANQGWFLIAKEPTTIPKFTIQVSERLNEGMVCILDDVDDLTVCLRRLLPRLGVPPNNVEEIQSMLVSKLFE